jgi:FeS assembly SUF system regulator
MLPIELASHITPVEDIRMLRISRLTDYGTLVLAHMALEPSRLYTAAEVSNRTGVAAPTVSQLLKRLARHGLLDSYRGSSGGYRLARPPEEISAAEILDALEGPLSLTECAGPDSGCELEHHCQVSGAWQSLNAAIRRALEEVSLRDLASTQATFGPLKLKRGARSDQGVPLHFRPRI